MTTRFFRLFDVYLIFFRLFEVKTPQCVMVISCLATPRHEVGFLPRDYHDVLEVM